MQILSQILLIVLVLYGILTFAGILVWVERRLLAFFQERCGPNRVGPCGTMQLLADLIKLLTKEDWIPPFADRPIFVLSPTIIFCTTLMSFSVIAFTKDWIIATLDIGLLFIFAMSSLSIYSIALAGWSSNNKYALIGSLRAMSQMISYELFLALSALPVVMLTGSFNLKQIVEAQQHLWFCCPLFVSLCLFSIALLAEIRRTPFDLPEAESELVAGYHTEYSGMKFALFFIGEYIGLILMSMLMVTLFFGGWLGPFLPPLVWFLLKTSILLFVLILIRGSLPRPRFEQVLGWGCTIMLPLSLLNILATGVILLLW